MQTPAPGAEPSGPLLNEQRRGASRPIALGFFSRPFAEGPQIHNQVEFLLFQCLSGLPTGDYDGTTQIFLLRNIDAVTSWWALLIA